MEPFGYLINGTLYWPIKTPKLRKHPYAMVPGSKAGIYAFSKSKNLKETLKMTGH